MMSHFLKCSHHGCERGNGEKKASSSTVEALRTWMEAEIRERKEINWNWVIQHWVLTGSWSQQPPVQADANELQLMHWSVCTNLCVRRCACVFNRLASTPVPIGSVWSEWRQTNPLEWLKTCVCACVPAALKGIGLRTDPCVMPYFFFPAVQF